MFCVYDFLYFTGYCTLIHTVKSVPLCIYLSYVFREDIHIGTVEHAGDWRNAGAGEKYGTMTFCK